MLSQSLSLRQLPGFPAKLSSLFGRLGGGGESKVGVWQPAPGSVHTPFYALSHSYTSQILSLCVRKRCSDRSWLPVFDKRVVQGENQMVSWSWDAKRCILTTLIFDVVIMKESVTFAVLLMDPRVRSQAKFYKTLHSLLCSVSYHWKKFWRLTYRREKITGTYLQNSCWLCFFLFHSQRELLGTQSNNLFFWTFTNVVWLSKWPCRALVSFRAHWWPEPLALTKTCVAWHGLRLLQLWASQTKVSFAIASMPENKHTYT